MKAFLDKLYLCEQWPNDYVNILVCVGPMTVKFHTAEKPRERAIPSFTAHSLEIHSMYRKTFPNENIDRGVILRFNKRNKVL